MRRPRRLRPGVRWFITVRCARAQYRLRPDTARVHALGVFLGRALEAYPGIRLFAAVQMSNHIHLVLEDRYSQLDRFMALLLGPLAKALNEMDRVRGQVYERRYSAIEILDDDALVDRIVYTLTNPVAADLVAEVDAWPGLILGPGFVEHEVFTRFRKRAYERACDLAHEGQEVDESDFHEEVRVDIDVPELNGDTRSRVRDEVRARLAHLGEARGRKTVLGAAKVLAQKPFDAPKRPKRGPAPLCLTRCEETWRAFVDEWRAFVAVYRAASAAFRAGGLQAAFPPWTFRPSMPLDHG